MSLSATERNEQLVTLLHGLIGRVNDDDKAKIENALNDVSRSSRDSSKQSEDDAKHTPRDTHHRRRFSFMMLLCLTTESPTWTAISQLKTRTGLDSNGCSADDN